MKVLQVINSLNSGGAEKLVADLCITYLKLGVDVELALLNGQKTAFTERLEKTGPELKIHVLGEAKDMYNPKHIFKLRRLLNQYDIVHVHLFPALYWGGFANLFGSVRAKLFYTEHNTKNRRRNHPILKHIDKLVYRQYNKIITISNSVDEQLKLHIGKKNDKLVKIYNGIDLNEINSAKPYKKEEIGFQEDDIVIIQVSSFTPQKDQLTLIKSLLFLPDRFKLALVGDGPLKTEYSDYVKKEGLKDRVLFLGIRNDVPRLLKTADVVVLSSLYEGLSLSSVEGLASGRPFISSDVPGLTEVVENAGLLFQSKDSKELGQLISSLFEDSELYKETVQKCMERAKTYDILTMAENYIGLYKKEEENHRS